MKKQGKIETLQNIVLVDTAEIHDVKNAEDAHLHILTFQSVIQAGLKSNTEIPDPETDSIATLCYTSGTTGYPKGAMMTHRNFIVMANALKTVGIDFGEEDTHLSYLPLAHIFERCVSITMVINGAAIGFFHGNILEIKDDLATLKPTFFVSVP